MYCKYCGNKLDDHCKFCPHCGKLCENPVEDEEEKVDDQAVSSLPVSPNIKEEKTDVPPTMTESAPTNEDRNTQTPVAKTSKHTEDDTDQSYYGKEFRKIRNGQKSKFNWAAFFFAPFHLLNHHNYSLFFKVQLPILILYDLAYLVVAIGAIFLFPNLDLETAFRIGNIATAASSIAGTVQLAFAIWYGINCNKKLYALANGHSYNVCNAMMAPVLLFIVQLCVVLAAYYIPMYGMQNALDDATLENQDSSSWQTEDMGDFVEETYIVETTSLETKCEPFTYEGEWLSLDGVWSMRIERDGLDYYILMNKDISESAFQLWSFEMPADDDSSFACPGVYSDLYLRDDGTVGGHESATNTYASFVRNETDGTVDWICEDNEGSEPITFVKVN